MQFLLTSLIFTLLSLSGTVTAGSCLSNHAPPAPPAILAPPAPHALLPPPPPAPPAIPATHCRTSLGENLNVLECSRAWRYLLSHTGIQHFTDAQLSSPRLFNLHDPDGTHKVPRYQAYKGCVVGFTSHQPSVVSNWRWLDQTVKMLMQECILRGGHGSGGLHEENGMILVVGAPSSLQVGQNSMS